MSWSGEVGARCRWVSGQESGLSVTVAGVSVTDPAANAAASRLPTERL